MSKYSDIQKIIEYYNDILHLLPKGGKLERSTALKIGIPEEIIPILEHAYKKGGMDPKHFEGMSQARIKDMLNKAPRIKNKAFYLDSDVVTSDLDKAAAKLEGTLTRSVIEELKKDYAITDRLNPEKRTRAQMESILRKATGDSKTDWNRIVRSEIVNNMNQGFADAILEGKSPYSDKGGETLVFKRPAPNACPHCKKHYLERDGKTPRLFKLSELMANGTNYGKKTAEWRPTLGVLHPHCYDDQTEVLTDSGFKYFKDLTLGDKVYTVNPETMEPEWQKPTDYIAYPYEGDMIHFKNKRFDMMVTPEHKMLVQRKGKKGYSEYYLDEASNIYDKTNIRIPSGITWRGKRPKTTKLGEHDVDIYLGLQFWAHWLSDGSCTYHEKQKKYFINIAKKDSKKLKEKFKELPFKVYECKDRGILFYDDVLGKELQKYGKCTDKFIPDFIKQLDSDLIAYFLDQYVECDGHKRKPREWKGYVFSPSKTLFTTSNQLSADLGELVMKAGGKPTYYMNKSSGKEIEFPNGVYTINHDVWIISWNKQKHSFTNNLNGKKVHYKGMVYCVEVPVFHTLYVRRNGKCAWSGNCACVLEVMPEGAHFEDGMIVKGGER